jgi:hypothetical protein
MGQAQESRCGAITPTYGTRDVAIVFKNQWNFFPKLNLGPWSHFTSDAVPVIDFDGYQRCCRALGSVPVP